MSFETAYNWLEQCGVKDRVRQFTVSSATVALAAEAVGVIPARIAKTLSFQLQEDAMLLVTAGDARIDNVKYKAKFHQKASMLAPELALQKTGHAVGGVCPFGVPEGLSVYLDVSLKRFSSIFPAVGDAASAVELGCDELFSFSRALEWVDVCKDWDETLEE